MSETLSKPDVVLTLGNAADLATRAEQQADTALICAKQRHRTWEGTVRLWFDAASLQFRDVHAGGARHLDLRSGAWEQEWSRQ